MQARIWTPSTWLEREREEGESLLLGGRVTDRSDAELGLGDAFRRVQVRFDYHMATLASVGPGDLLVLQVEYRSEYLRVSRVVTVQHCPESRGDGEVAALAWNGRSHRLVARARALRAVREWFDHEGFLEVTTPTILSFPTFDRHVTSLRAADGFLVTSPELALKRLIVGGVPRVFEVARCFRGDEQGPLHDREFTLIEWYRAFTTMGDMMSDTEALVRVVATAVSSDGELHRGQRHFDVSRPFLRLTVQQAFSEALGEKNVAELALHDPEQYHLCLVEQIEPMLRAIDLPVFLTRYPLADGALARPCDDDPLYCERFELFVGGVELCNGYGELSSASEQRDRFETARRQARSSAEFDERFLAALVEGLPPTAGNALGFDRLVMLALGMDSIFDARTFA